MQYFIGHEEESPESTTLIAVPIDRLKKEYCAGVDAQRADEHWRKQLRIMLGLGSTGAAVLFNVLGASTEAGAYLALFLNCLLHVLL